MAAIARLSAAPAVTSEPGYELVLALRRAQHALALALDDALADVGTNAAHLAVLREVRAHPGAASAELARRARVTPQTFGQHVKELVRRGLVECAPGPGRRLEHSLTRAGERLLDRATERALAVQASVLRDLDERERTALAAALEAVTRRASEERRRRPGAAEAATGRARSARPRRAGRASRAATTSTPPT
ncbi:MAG TPA: MarR family transcriptional regulator [Gaiellaceae bacterium]|nr:MarR family transcriptional regulator [Gaiellaceae bacterium]